jgi:hypothetical protein
MDEIERSLIAQGVPPAKAHTAALGAPLDGNPADPPTAARMKRPISELAELRNSDIQRSDLDATELVIRVPMPPTLTNSGTGRSRHWWSVNDEKKRYYRQLDELQLAGFIEKPPRRAIGTATVRSLMTLGGKMDDDNAMARHKWPIDWLATRGYIRSDRLLRWTALPTQVVKRGGEYSIELTIAQIVGDTLEPILRNAT